MTVTTRHGHRGLTRAQDTALRRLVADGRLSADQFDAVREALRTAETTASEPRRVAELFGYVGGGLMLAGAALLIGTSWADLTRAGRIVVLVIAALVLLSSGVLIGGGPRRLLARDHPVEPARTRVSGVLFALTAVVGALTAATAASSDEGVWAAATALGLAAAGYLVQPSLAGLAVGAVASFALVSQVVDLIGGNALTLAGSLILLGVAWGALTAAQVVRPLWAGLTVAASIALIGAQQPLGTTGLAAWAYGLTVGVAALCFAVYPAVRSAVLPAAGVLGVTVAVPEAIWDWTDGSVGGAASVLIAGAVLLAVGGLSLRLGR
ncbi:DUF2157 domain-containing protein [Actinokineospora sp. HUAS TT18]|uniref:DUF2157 domain-containing protein n=1 Tax=Actinokineospora sp. HUAS TT18 TaxID=3447451 RepID=UPI003F51AF9A